MPHSLGRTQNHLVEPKASSSVATGQTTSASPREQDVDAQMSVDEDHFTLAIAILQVKLSTHRSFASLNPKLAPSNGTKDHLCRRNATPQP
jgi:hypothetical protein